MTESGTESPAILWSVPQCPFTIEASARVLDDIRLAVTDAFFSLPRGGAEIGGILLGKFDGAKLVISGYAALECEHANGPSFTLSPGDEERLSALVATHGGFGGGLRTAGWYHSHTRSEIFLSDADVSIHQRFFPEPWQVALVLKPHTFQPTRFGYFFRDGDGSVHASACYGEGQLDALPLRQVPGGPPSAPEENAPQPRSLRPAAMFAPVVDISGDPFPASGAGSFAPTALPASGYAPSPGYVPPPAFAVTHSEVAPPVALPPLAEIPAPKFAVESASSARRWMTVSIAVVAGLGIGAAGLQTRELWLPRVMASIRPAQAAPPVIPPGLQLTTLDREGQLQISWDRNAASLRDATDGVLEIKEGGAVVKAVPLDAGNLQTGTFTYARTADQVDIKLVVHRKSGADLRASSSFLGKLPERKADEDAAALKEREAEAIKQRDEMAKQAAKMKADLNSQAAKTRKLEKDMTAIRQEMRLQQRRRLANQAPGK